jgi:glucose-1-phosphate cytidylyltransferase
MKVVLFCGGLGMRLLPKTDAIPKPLVTIGGRPVLWHIMKYYSYYGHTDFVLCLGYKGEQIKNYFLRYDECLTNDFIFSNGGATKQLLNRDIDKWTITFVETGLNANIGQRLKAVQKHLEDEDEFLANYSDAVTNLNLSSVINCFHKSGKKGCLVTVKPFYSYHIVSSGENGIVEVIEPLSKSSIRINGGYFAFKKEIFDYIKPGEDLVEEPLQRLIKEGELVAYPYDGFWANMDTYKDKQLLDDIALKGNAPWEIWNH